MSKSYQCDCDNQNNNSSGFMFGLVLGAIIGAILAILIYKHNKSQVVKILRSKLDSIFQLHKAIKSAPASKIPVVLPPKFPQKPVSQKTTPLKKGKMFIKPKK